MHAVQQQTWLKPAVRYAAAAGFAGYLAWNAYWLGQAAVPPSLFAVITGLPCPTTGMTRSGFALLRGDIQRSLFWNAFTVPLMVLLLATMFRMMVAYKNQQRLVLPVGWGWVWAALLLAAWFGKAITGPESW